MKHYTASIAGNGRQEVSQERHLIQVEFPPAHAGIVAALRRAFDDTRPSNVDDEFAELLEKLN